MDIYLAILEDRHIDNVYQAFKDESKAIKCCKRWEKSYHGHYQWEEEYIAGWPYNARTEMDDGPKTHVEKIKLWGMPSKR